MSKISEELVEPLDGIVAKALFYPIYSRLEVLLLEKHLSQAQLSLTAMFSALASGLAFYFGNLLVGGTLTLLTLIICWLAWRLAVTGRTSRLWLVIGSTLDRAGEAFIISGIILSPFIEGNPWRIVGIIALIGSLTVSYTATRSGREFGRSVWRGFSAYGATRDIRLTLIVVSSIIGVIPWGLVSLAILTFSVIMKRIIDILPLG